MSSAPLRRAALALLAGVVLACGGAPEPAPSPPAPATPPPVTSQDARIRELEAIGYLDGYTPAGELRGVTVHDPARAWSGYNLVNSGHAPAAVLLDMDGKELHRWSLPFAVAFPEQGRALLPEEKGNRWDDWRRVRLLPDGGLLAIHEGFGLVALDVRSKRRWAVADKAHHDLTFTGDGRLLVLSRTAHVVERLRPDPVLEDFVITVDPATGAELDRFSLLEAFEGTPHAGMLDHLTPHGDIFHTNALVWLDGRGSEVAPFLARGNLLISVRNTSTVAVVDGATHKVVWAQRGPWRSQHDPSVVGPGRLLVFDNLGDHGRSRLVEWDVVSRTIVGSYVGTPDRPFQSKLLGAAQRLPNGNTLATDSERGRAFEVTADGAIVWEYWNPERAGRSGELVATLIEVDRVPPADVAGWLVQGETR